MEIIERAIPVGGAVSYASQQTLTEEQQATARGNIGAITKQYVDEKFVNCKKLWSNASPTSAFAAQTVSFEVDPAKPVIIEYAGNSENSGNVRDMHGSRQYIAVSPVSGTTWYLRNFYVAGGVEYVSYRDVTITLSGTAAELAFSVGYLWDIADYNSNCVPMNIYQ